MKENINNVLKNHLYRSPLLAKTQKEAEEFSKLVNTGGILDTIQKERRDRKRKQAALVAAHMKKKHDQMKLEGKTLDELLAEAVQGMKQVAARQCAKCGQAISVYAQGFQSKPVCVDRDSCAARLQISSLDKTEAGM